MAKRRGRGEGTISRRADGRWQGRVDLGRGPDGRRQRKVIYGATRQAAASELNRLLGRAESGELLGTSTPTVSTWLNDWYRTHQDEWRPTTRRTYRIAIDQWIVPQLGTLRLEKLKPTTIQRWINEATTAGGRQKVILAHVVLRSALKWAMQQRQVTYNAAALVKVPPTTPTRCQPLTTDQAKGLIAVAADHRLGPLVLVSLTMGLRIGEVSGLAWSDLDLDGRTLRVRQQVQALANTPPELAPLKTPSSRRTLVMPAFVAEELKAHRKRQLEERLRAGQSWLQTSDLVFATPTGHPLHPGRVRDVLAALLKAAGLPPVRFHTLRHTAATLLLMDGAPLFDVSRILGHTEISTTANIYGHLVDEMAAGAAARMDALLAESKAKA